MPDLRPGYNLIRMLLGSPALLSSVIASVAKQSMRQQERMDCFVARAPRNDAVRADSNALPLRLLLHVDASRKRPRPDASPAVSNIAALMASAADLPAQTTNWNAG